MKRKIRVGRAETGNEVIFECLNGTFGKVVTMKADWGKFIVYIIVSKQ